MAVFFLKILLTNEHLFYVSLGLSVFLSYDYTAIILYTSLCPSVCMLCSFLLYCLADLTVEFKFFSTYICCCQYFLNTFLGLPGPFGLSTANKMEITMLKHQESASRGKIVSMLKFKNYKILQFYKGGVI